MEKLRFLGFFHYKGSVSGFCGLSILKDAFAVSSKTLDAFAVSSKTSLLIADKEASKVIWRY